MDSDNDLACNLFSRMRRLRREMNDSYYMCALYGGIIDIEKGAVVSPDKIDYRNINLEESVRCSIRALYNSRALRELTELTRDLYGDIPELSLVEEEVKNVIKITELLNNGFIGGYSFLKDNPREERYSFLKHLSSFLPWRRRKD